ncbi:hypothetical protein MNBD_PLANCTO02-1243 [hydrothermal vent metagenome]|uniref:RNA polymerase sigma factor 70 region 4 type 2 domain-containing protein n=1 Tax=hydrothermal vent metagenome TaxID=652676 RepID=A0A3B1DCH3_9ZZZZ
MKRPQSEKSIGELPPIDWNAQLQRHCRWLRTVIAARTREWFAVEEVFQEMAVIVAGQGGRLQNVENIQAWLYRVAVRQSLLYRRRKGRQRKLQKQYVEKQGGSSEIDQQQYDPLHWLLANETRQLVRVAMKRLSGKDAEILMLKYTEDWSYQQLADHLGIGTGAVESRLHRARGRLRTELQQLNVNEVIS